MDQLPRHLRSETLLFLYRGLLRRVAFFQDCEDNFFATLASFLKPQIYSPHDYIITFGDVGEEVRTAHSRVHGQLRIGLL